MVMSSTTICFREPLWLNQKRILRQIVEERLTSVKKLSVEEPRRSLALKKINQKDIGVRVDRGLTRLKKTFIF